MSYAYAASDGEEGKSRSGRLSTAGVNEQNKETTKGGFLASFIAMFTTDSALTPAKSYICKS